VAAAEKVVDTTGAGDSFNGAYLAATLAGSDRASAVARAQAVSARVIGERGALIPPDALRAAFGASPPVSG
jgi:2-dehydro-3-deoxygluconokinase